MSYQIKARHVFRLPGDVPAELARLPCISSAGGGDDGRLGGDVSEVAGAMQDGIVVTGVRDHFAFVNEGLALGRGLVRPRRGERW